MSLFKSDFEKHYQLGLEYHNNDKFDEAIKEFQLAIEIKKDSPEVYFCLGNAYNVKNMQKEAVECYKECLKINPNFSKAKYMLKLLSNEHVERVDQRREETIEEVASTYKLGLECVKKNMFEDAVLAWEKTIKLFPNFEKVHYNMGVAYYKLNKLDEAIKYWKQAKMIDPNDDSIYFNLGVAYYQQSKINEAIKEWEKGKELNPRNEKIACNLAVAYYDIEKKIQKPMNILQDVLKSNPSYELARDNLQKLFIQK